MKILTISGSLRKASLNSALLRAFARLAPPPARVDIFRGLGGLPLFNPDLDSRLPPPVVAWRAFIASADALLIASPEYAHGTSGPLKNALDWLVSGPEFVDKPVAIVNASARAHHADGALRETVRTMSALIVEAASVTIPLLPADLVEGELQDSAGLQKAIGGVLDALGSAVKRP